MKKSIILAILCTFTGAGSALSAEECRLPTAPELPQNGAIISHDQLTEAADQVKVFSKLNTSYKKCLDIVITQPSNVTRIKWREAWDAYNETGPAEQVIWSAYEALSKDWVTANQAKPKS